MKVLLKPHTLKLQHPFTISRGSYSTRPTLIVELKEGVVSGYGEASSNPYYGISVPKMIEDITAVQPIIETLSKNTPEKFWEEVYPHLKHNRFALCAIDIAYHDLFTRKKGVKLYEYWGFNIKNNPLTNYTIGIDTMDKMIAKIKEKPWPVYKIKLGTKDDIAIIEELRKHTSAVFRVDANCGWRVDETLNNAKAFKKMGVEFIEQPLKANDWEGSKKLFDESVLPIIADESCRIESDVDKCYRHFHGINIKLVKCGGLTPAKKMLLHAKKLGMKTMVGCMVESSVGISAIAHLLPLLDYVDMDGILLLAHDIAKGVSIKNGVIHYSPLNGTGVSLLE